MSVNKRRALAIGAFLAFVVLVPIVILYVNGYRLILEGRAGATSLTSTGAIMLDALVPGSSVYVDGVYFEDTPNFFSESMFIEDLDPGSHTIDIVATGTIPWHKDVVVLPRYISQASALILPDPIPMLKVLPDTQATSSPNSSSTSTSPTISHVPRDQYELLEAIFNPASSTPVAVSSSTARISSQTAVWAEQGHIIVFEWRGSDSRIPRFFCSVIEQLNVCVRQLFVPVRSFVKSVEFFPGRRDVALVLTSSGLFALETDADAKKPAIAIYRGSDIDFRVRSGSIYVKDGADLFYVQL